VSRITRQLHLFPKTGGSLIIGGPTGSLDLISASERGRQEMDARRRVVIRRAPIGHVDKWNWLSLWTGQAGR